MPSRDVYWAVNGFDVYQTIDGSTISICYSFTKLYCAPIEDKYRTKPGVKSTQGRSVRVSKEPQTCSKSSKHLFPQSLIDYVNIVT